MNPHLFIPLLILRRIRLRLQMLHLHRDQAAARDIRHIRQPLLSEIAPLGDDLIGETPQRYSQLTAENTVLLELRPTYFQPARSLQHCCSCHATTPLRHTAEIEQSAASNNGGLGAFNFISMLSRGTLILVQWETSLA